ncbi:NADPH-dependent FMN reductase [Streptomyces sp. NPDC048550]|uniref:NADPH-dependent FMN reductase n=1 Tax=unclassified Streptomyces TaxID=2593676 RepID=UPI000A8FE4D2|nr:MULTISPECIES: NADPH-dependent FMN reductase [unclassified Streptomyces]MCX5146583.1 NAD(P)H-dependent oxidoreductase [Streptomyces sp. NBC_00320]WSN49769.1 NADPH-dependent FMN reductase [Streptomyces sp. NBC_01296]WSW60812.1 NAD(P)H-dependent oxidoreductase [Streptomyces sp. NBC_00998]
MPELKILAISGSLRGASYNSALVRAAQKFAPGDLAIEIYEGLRDIPPYDTDHDVEPSPVAVADLRRRIAEADGIFIATPEYNYGIPGVLKNALDWASRPALNSSLTGKPIAIAGAAQTNFGTVRAQLALRQMFLWTDSKVVGKPELMIFRAQERFDDGGNLTDETTVEILQGLLSALGTKIRETRANAAAGL